VIPLSMQHYMKLQRDAVYTGVTRGKRLVLLRGQWIEIDRERLQALPRHDPPGECAGW
jgi:hypothetical protein